MKTIVIIGAKEVLPYAYLVNGDLREENGNVMSGDLWLTIYGNEDSEESKPIDIGAIPNYIKSSTENVYCVSVTEE